MLLPLDVIAPPLHPLGAQCSALGHLTLPPCCRSCLLGGSMGEWYVWSPEGTESGLPWHVHPGSLRSPRGREESQAQTTSGGREAGAEVTRGEESSVQIHGLLASPEASGVCLLPGVVTVALRCSGLSAKCGGVQPVGSVLAAVGRVHPAGSASVRSTGQGQSCDGTLGPVRVLSGCPQRSQVPLSSWPAREGVSPWQATRQVPNLHVSFFSHWEQTGC